MFWSYIYNIFYSYYLLVCQPTDCQIYTFYYYDDFNFNIFLNSFQNLCKYLFYAYITLNMNINLNHLYSHISCLVLIHKNVCFKNITFTNIFWFVYNFDLYINDT